MPGSMLVIGLTGGIGTGKTEVSKILEELGAEVIHADILGHEVYRAGTEAWHEVVEAFGEGVLGPTGEVERRKLGAIVFGKPEALQRLNAITHPRIRKMLEERIEGLRRRGKRVVVVEAALLVEANWTPLVDEVWVTATPQDQVIGRLRGRDGLQEADVLARIGSQMVQGHRVERADVVIDNAGSLAELREQVEAIWRRRVLVHRESLS